MRHAIQIAVMLGDLETIGAVAIVVYFCPSLLSVVAAIIAFKIWSGQEGFIAWNKRDINAFMTNAKKLGL